MQIHNLPEKTAIADSDVFAVDNGTTNNKVKTSTLGKKVTEDGAPAYTCNDVADGQATAWTAVAKLVSGEALKTTLSKLSLMFKNVRYLYKLIGTTNIAALSSDGTITGALSKLNTDSIKNPTLLTSSNDMDYVTEPGIYFQANADMPANAPLSDAYNSSIIVLRGRLEYDRFQIWLSINKGAIWIRQRQATWNEWRRLF